MEEVEPGDKMGMMSKRGLPKAINNIFNSYNDQSGKDISGIIIDLSKIGKPDNYVKKADSGYVGGLE